MTISAASRRLLLTSALSITSVCFAQLAPPQQVGNVKPEKELETARTSKKETKDSANPAKKVMPGLQSPLSPANLKVANQGAVEPSTNDTNKTQQPLNKKCHIKFVTADVIQLCLGFIALFSLGTTVFLVFITRNGSRMQLRAYLGADSITALPTAANYIVKNLGQTPASDVITWHGGSNIAVDLSTIVNLTRQPPVRAGGVIWHGNYVSRTVNFAQGQQSNPFYIYGVIDYTDAFGKKQRTTFQYAVEMITSNTCNFWMHTEGNTTT